MEGSQRRRRRRPVLLTLTAALLVFPAAAHATATFSCETNDKGLPALTLEGHAPFDGNGLLDLRGEIEIERGKPLAFSKTDVKTFYWKKTMRFGIRRNIAPGEFFEIKIRTRAGEDEVTFPGTYEIRTGKKKFRGKILCSGG
jgi:hypothetical protein